MASNISFAFVTSVTNLGWPKELAGRQRDFWSPSVMVAFSFETWRPGIREN